MNFQLRNVCISRKDTVFETNCTKISGGTGLRCHLLGLSLFSHILDGLTLFADDGAHKLRRHKNAQRKVVMPGAWRAAFPRGPGVGGALIPGRTATAAAAAARAGRLVGRRRLHVHDVGHLKGVVVKLASC